MFAGHGEQDRAPSSARLSAARTPLNRPSSGPRAGSPGRAPPLPRQDEVSGPAAPAPKTTTFRGRASPGPAESGGRTRPGLRASPSPEPPRPDGAPTPVRGEPARAAARGINTRGNNHLVVVVVTQTLGKVQVGGVSGERAARRSRVKSYIHAGGLVQEVHLERPPGGLIDPPSSAFPGVGARANRRGSGAAGRRACPRAGTSEGRGAAGTAGEEEAEKCR